METSTEHGNRTFVPNDLMAQIGTMNILAISGGRVAIRPNGLVLPVSNGYRVEIFLADNDTYTVQRVFVRGGKRFLKGQRTDVYFDEVGETAYMASNFRSHPNW